eukprot:gene24075-9653_t
MGCCGEFLLKIFRCIINLLEVGCAIAIIIIIALHLQDVTIRANADGNSDVLNSDVLNDVLNGEIEFSCALGNLEEQAKGDTATNYCAYAYSLAGVSLALSLAMSILLCFTCNLSGCGFIVEMIVALCLCLWWIAGGIVLSKAVSDANDWGQNWDDFTNAIDNLLGEEMTQDNWRTSIPILAWTACVCSFLTFMIYFFQLACGCCSCGGGGGGGDAREAKKYAMEAKESQKAAEKAQKAVEKANMEAGLVGGESTTKVSPFYLRAASGKGDAKATPV